MPKKNVCYDHLGNSYNTFEEMCKVYNKERGTVLARLRRGWTLEEALTKEIDESNKPKICKDHLGNSYDSFVEMCKTYNKNITTVQNRLKKG